MAKINQEEYQVLKGLDNKLKWIARDWSELRNSHNHLFKFIQWEDGEPHNIDELIQEYESEEAEYPKFIQEEYEHLNWLSKRVKKEIKRKDENLGLLDWNSREADRLSGQIEAFEHIEMLINEIGKPSYFRKKDRESEPNGKN